MESPDILYKKHFFKIRRKLAWRAPMFADAVLKILSPRSIIDFGCGNGDLLSAFLERSIKVVGVESTVNAIPFMMIPESFVFIHDIREARVFGKFDLCLCLEVAEHVEKEFEDIILGNLTAASDRILFSAAGPGQEGHYHVNLQTKEYWEDRFKAFGYIRKTAIEDTIKNFWGSHRNIKGIKAYYYNMIFLEKETSS